MSDVNWANAVSMVATADGLLVTERGADGTVGAAPTAMQKLLTAQRQTPKLGAVHTYTLTSQKLLPSKALKKPGGELLVEFPMGTLTFDATEAEALNWAQTAEAPPGYCIVLSVKQGNRWFLVWSSCPGYDPLEELYQNQGVGGVPEEGGDLGASPRPGFRAPAWDPQGRQKNSSFPRTPEEFGNPDAKMSCTDSSLKTYRFIVAPKGFVRDVNDVMTGKQQPGRYMMPFKACSDADAWAVLFSPYTIFDEANCWRLERLDAKPGYVSAWTLVKTLNC